MSNSKEFNYNIGDDFIGVFHNVYPEGFCSSIISQVDKLQDGGLVGHTRRDSERALHHEKDDWAMDGRTTEFDSFNGERVQDIYQKGMQKCFDIYSEKFSTLRTTGDVSTSVMKIQKTSSGGGYHIWHHEQGAGLFASRVLVFTVYLNTVETSSCGETEFLYQQRRIQPIENTIVLWPATYTHVHRGNPLYGDAHKYIITGWYHYGF